MARIKKKCFTKLLERARERKTWFVFGVLADLNGSCSNSGDSRGFEFDYRVLVSRKLPYLKGSIWERRREKERLSFYNIHLSSQN